MTENEKSGALTYRQGTEREKGKEKPPKGYVEFIMQDGTRYALPYGQCSVHYFPKENPESIRFKTINDEALIYGHNLTDVYLGLRNRLLESVQEFTDTAGGGDQPKLLNIEILDAM